VASGQRVALRDATGLYFLVTDHLGSVVAVTNNVATVVYEQRYKPFGQPRLGIEGAPTDFGFTGQRSLAGAGLQDFNARWFDTSLGMFGSADTMVPDPFNPQALNRYGYVLNNPLRFTDPTGMFFCEDTVGRCTPPPRPAPQPRASSGSSSTQPRQTSRQGGVQQGTGSVIPPQAAPVAPVTAQPLQQPHGDQKQQHEARVDGAQLPFFSRRMIHALKPRYECGVRNAECGIKEKTAIHSRFRIPHSEFRIHV